MIDVTLNNSELEFLEKFKWAQSRKHGNDSTFKGGNRHLGNSKKSTLLLFDTTDGMHDADLRVLSPLGSMI